MRGGYTRLMAGDATPRRRVSRLHFFLALTALSSMAILSSFYLIPKGGRRLGSAGVEVEEPFTGTIPPRRRAKRTEYTHVTSGNMMITDSYITPGDSIGSTNGMFHANLSHNGIFRVYKHDSFAGERVIYELGTPPYVQTQMGVRPGRRAEGEYHAMILNDGNLVIQKGPEPKKKHFTIDSSKIDKKQKRGKYRAVLNDDGSFVVYNSTSQPLWWSNPAALYMKEFLEDGDYLISPSGTHFAILVNYSLATYEGFGPTDPSKKKTFEWKIRKDKLPARRGARIFASIMEDGDFQLFSGSSPSDQMKRIAIRSRTGGPKKKMMDNYFAYMQDDGEFVLYGGRGTDMSQFEKVWSNYDACLNHAEVAFSNLAKHVPVMGPIYKEVSALVYSFKPWCKQVAKERFMDGVKSVGSTLGFAMVPLGFRLVTEARTKGWKSVLRIRDRKNDKPSHYDMLGVSRGATDEEIRKAYMQKSRDCHPDKFHNEKDKKQMGKLMQDMTVASEILLNAQKRNAYDAELPLFDFGSTKDFFGTMGHAVTSCLGIRNEIASNTDFTEDGGPSIELGADADAGLE